jgi:hypothetical protein
MNGGRSPEANFLLQALRGPTPAATPELLAAADGVRDWDLVVKLAAQHRVAPWLLEVFKDRGCRSAVPENVLTELRRSAWGLTLSGLALGRALEEVVLALEAAEVSVLVLKGPAVAEQLYPRPELRPYTDIDILVGIERHADVAAVCRQLGYEMEEDHGGPSAAHAEAGESAYETLYVRRNPYARLDIHYDHLQLGLQPKGSSGVRERSAPWRFQRASARVPGLQDLLLLLVVHLHRHGFNRLIWFKDLDLLLRNQGHTLDWQALSRSLKEEGAETSLAEVLRRLEKLLDTPIPTAARKLCRRTPGGLLASFLWPEASLFRLDSRPGSWRRAVQFVPWDGARGVLPSLLFMGRRRDKLRALLHRLPLGRREPPADPQLQ